MKIENSIIISYNGIEMPKDPRYTTIKVLIEAGHIMSFREIFVFIPKTVVYRDLGVNFNRFDSAIANPSKFRIKELMRLG